MLVFCEVKRLRVRSGVFVNYYMCVVVTSKNEKKTVWKRCDCCRQPYPTKSNTYTLTNMAGGVIIPGSRNYHNFTTHSPSHHQWDAHEAKKQHNTWKIALNTLTKLWDLYLDQGVFVCRPSEHRTTKTLPFYGITRKIYRMTNRNFL